MLSPLREGIRDVPQPFRVATQILFQLLRFCLDGFGGMGGEDQELGVLATAARWLVLQHARRGLENRLAEAVSHNGRLI
jgi:hypothetical protein